MTTPERIEAVMSGVLAWESLGGHLPVGHDHEKTVGLKCPSYPGQARGELFAVLDDEFGLRFVSSSEEIDDQVARFFGPCVATRCRYWSKSCQLGAVVTKAPIVVPDVFVRIEPESCSNECPIGTTCRWRAENGNSVCVGCQGVSYLGSRESLS